MSSVACCSGFIDSGTPKGAAAHIGGVNAYVALPDTQPTKAVVITTDIFGYTLPNVRLIADAFATAGFLAVVPDMFNGDHGPHEFLSVAEAPAPGMWLSALKNFRLAGWATFSLLPWLLRHSPGEKVIQIVVDVISAVKSEYSLAEVFVQGYCYGGKVALSVAAREGVADRVAVAHPSLLSLPKDVVAVRVPVLFLCAEKDQYLPAANCKQIEVILSNKKQSGLKIFKGTQHGFAVRGNENDPAVLEARRCALQDAIDFFNIGGST